MNRYLTSILLALALLLGLAAPASAMRGPHHHHAPFWHKVSVDLDGAIAEGQLGPERDWTKCYYHTFGRGVNSHLLIFCPRDRQFFWD